MPIHQLTERRPLRLQEAAFNGNEVKYLHIETPITKTTGVETVTHSSISDVKISEFEFEIDTTKLAG